MPTITLAKEGLIIDCNCQVLLTIPLPFSDTLGSCIKVELDIEDDACTDITEVSGSAVPSPPVQEQSKKKGKTKQKTSSCPLCSLSFQTKKAVKEHLEEVHNTGSQFKCPVCSKKCKSAVDLWNHMNKKHKNAETKAEGSGKTSTRSSKSTDKKVTSKSTKSKKQSKKAGSMKKEAEEEGEFYDGETEVEFSDDEWVISGHEKATDDTFIREKKVTSNVKCTECGKEYKSKRALRRHIATIHDMNDYHCDICGKNFTGKESLYHHKRGIHEDLRPYKCPEPGCDASFNFNHSLSLHKLKHSGSRPHQCSDCGKTYLTAYHLKVHTQAIHNEKKQFSCSVCGKMFSYSTSLKMHEASHQKHLRVRCDQCDKTFVNAQALKYHILSKHSAPGHYPCKECKKVYRTEFLLRTHMRRHSKDGSRFMCDLCGRQFMYKSALEMHKAVHKDEKTFQCKICNKTFKTYPTLYSHRNVHKKESPYECGECGKAFKTKERCKAHEKRHSGLKPFECSICHHCFPDNGGLSKHMKTVHCAVKKFVCHICGKAASRADNLRVHMKVHFKGDGTSAVQKTEPNVVEIKSDMPTVVPLTMHGTLLKKDRGEKKDKKTQKISVNTLSAVTDLSNQTSQPQFENFVLLNQNLPNLPMLDSSQLSSNSREQSLPLNLQNHSNAVSVGYQGTKLITSSDDKLTSKANSNDPQATGQPENVTIPSAMQIPSSASVSGLQASPVVYAGSVWPNLVYTTGQSGGSNGFFQ